MRVARLGPFIGLLLSVPKRFRTSLPSAHFLTPRVFFPNGKLRVHIAAGAKTERFAADPSRVTHKMRLPRGSNSTLVSFQNT
jgi:hypothetical protein